MIFQKLVLNAISEVSLECYFRSLFGMLFQELVLNAISGVSLECYYCHVKPKPRHPSKKGDKMSSLSKKSCPLF